MTFPAGMFGRSRSANAPDLEQRQRSTSSPFADPVANTALGKQLESAGCTSLANVGILLKYVSFKGWRPRLFVLQADKLYCFKINGPSAVDVIELLDVLKQSCQVNVIGIRAYSQKRKRAASPWEAPPPWSQYMQKAQVVIPLGDCDVCCSQSDSRKLVIRSSAQTFQCSAETSDDCAAWVHALLEAKGADDVFEEGAVLATGGVPKAWSGLREKLRAGGAAAELLDAVGSMLLLHSSNQLKELEEEQRTSAQLMQQLQQLQEDKRQLETQLLKHALNAGSGRRDVMLNMDSHMSSPEASDAEEDDADVAVATGGLLPDVDAPDVEDEVLATSGSVLLSQLASLRSHERGNDAPGNGVHTRSSSLSHSPPTFMANFSHLMAMRSSGSNTSTSRMARQHSPSPSVDLQLFEPHSTSAGMRYVPAMQAEPPRPLSRAPVEPMLLVSPTLSQSNWLNADIPGVGAGDGVSRALSRDSNVTLDSAVTALRSPFPLSRRDSMESAVTALQSPYLSRATSMVTAGPGSPQPDITLQPSTETVAELLQAAWPAQLPTAASTSPRGPQSPRKQQPAALGYPIAPPPLSSVMTGVPIVPPPVPSMMTGNHLSALYDLYAAAAANAIAGSTEATAHASSPQPPAAFPSAAAPSLPTISSPPSLLLQPAMPQPHADVTHTTSTLWPHRAVALTTPMMSATPPTSSSGPLSPPTSLLPSNSSGSTTYHSTISTTHQSTLAAAVGQPLNAGMLAQALSAGSGGSLITLHQGTPSPAASPQLLSQPPSRELLSSPHSSHSHQNGSLSQPHSSELASHQSRSSGALSQPLSGESGGLRTAPQPPTDNALPAGAELQLQSHSSETDVVRPLPQRSPDHVWLRHMLQQQLGHRKDSRHGTPAGSIHHTPRCSTLPADLDLDTLARGRSARTSPRCRSFEKLRPSGLASTAVVPKWLLTEPGAERPRRVRLPRPQQVERPVSLWSLLRECIGKDLSRICLPVYFNEPLGALQKCCEDMEYAELLDTAAAQPAASLQRLLYVCAFAVSGYACTAGRTRKPFNPLLGETYELVCPEKRFRFIAEKVVHHPPVVAMHAEGVSWTLDADTEVKSKFWGRSIEVTPEGVFQVTFSDGEVYSWKKVTSSINNIILGKIYIDHGGVMNVQCIAGAGANCYSARLVFCEQSLFNRGRHAVHGSVDLDGQRLSNISLHGHWDRDLFWQDASHPQGTRLLWQRSPPAEDPTRYNLTRFAIMLNEMSEELKGRLPPTDTRLRPDQRNLELGIYDESNREKLRLEEKQRAARRAADRGDPIQARWFQSTQGVKMGQALVYRYQGGYWENRDARSWEGCRDIFGLSSAPNGGEAPEQP